MLPSLGGWQGTLGVSEGRLGTIEGTMGGFVPSQSFFASSRAGSKGAQVVSGSSPGVFEGKAEAGEGR